MSNSGNQHSDNVMDSVKHIVVTIFGTEDHTKEFIEKEREENKVFGILSYIIPPIPFLIERNSKYVVFHSSQGMNNLVYLLLAFLITWVTGIAAQGHPYVGIIRNVCIYIYIILSLIGVWNALQNKAREIPLTSKFNFIEFIGNFIG